MYGSIPSLPDECTSMMHRCMIRNTERQNIHYTKPHSYNDNYKSIIAMSKS